MGAACDKKMVITNEMRRPSRPKAQPKKPKASTHASSKKQGGRSSENSQAENHETSNNTEEIEGIDDLDEDVQSQLPSQEHCTWLLNIIQIHSRKMAKELLDDHVKTIVEPLQQEIKSLKEENQQMRSEIGKLKWSRDGINKELARKTTEIEQFKQDLDILNQKQREHRVRISGVAEEEGEDLTKKVLELAKKKMGLKKIKDTDVAQIHRSGKKKA